MTFVSVSVYCDGIVVVLVTDDRQTKRHLGFSDDFNLIIFPTQNFTKVQHVHRTQMY